MNTKTREKIAREFQEYLGENNTLLQLDNNEKELYDEFYEKISNIFDRNEDKTEKQYNERLYDELQKEFKYIEVIEENINNFIKKYYIINNNLVINIRKQHTKEDINDLAKFLRQEDKLIGIIICIRKRDYKMYMLLREDMIEGCEYHCYNGEESFSFKIHEKRCSELKKEEKIKKENELRQQISKEELEKLINKYGTYSEIALKINTNKETVKQCCDLYDLQTLMTKNYKERRYCPDDYKEIDMDPVKKQLKIKEYCKIIKDKPKKYKGNEKGIYGIFDRETRECIYIGSTQNLGERIENHKKNSETERSQMVHKYIKETGGWEEYTIELLEARERHEGLNYIEALWCEALSPKCNCMSPLKK